MTSEPGETREQYESRLRSVIDGLLIDRSELTRELLRSQESTKRLKAGLKRNEKMMAVRGQELAAVLSGEWQPIPQMPLPFTEEECNDKSS